MQADTTLWNRCVRDLQAELPEQQFNTWIRPLQAVDDGQVLKLLAPNRFVVDWLQQNYIERILEPVDSADESTSEVVVEVGSRPVRSAPRVISATSSMTKKFSNRPVRGPAPVPLASRLQPDFTFDAFVEGKSNQLARAAAFQVGQNLIQ